MRRRVLQGSIQSCTAGTCTTSTAFAEDGDADTFMRRFGGETFDPKQRGKRAQPGEVE